MSDYDPTTFVGDSYVTTYDAPVTGSTMVVYFDHVIMPKVIVVPTPPQSAEAAAILGLSEEIEALNDEVATLKAMIDDH